MLRSQRMSRGVTSLLLGLSVALGCDNVAAQGSPARKVWFEYGLASLMTGRLPSGPPVGLEIYVVAIGPVSDEPQEDTIRTRNRAVVPELVTVLSDTLDRGIATMAERLEQAPVGKREEQRKGAHDKLVSEIGEAVAVMQRGYQARVGGGGAVAGAARRYNLAIVMRSCDGSPGSCVLGAFAVSTPNRSTERFGKVYEWLKPAIADKVNVFAVVDGTVPKMVPAQQLAEAKGSPWRPLPDAPTRVAQLETAVAQARRTKVPLNALVPQVLAIGQTSTVRFVDVLSDPYEALNTIPREQGPALAKISDELARARVSDCAKLRGSTKPEDVMACAGYKGDATAIAQCLSGGRCFPNFGDRTIADVALISKPGSIKGLIAESAAPRLKLGAIAEVEKAGRDCAAKHPNDQTAAIACLVIARVSPADRATIDCARRGVNNPSVKSLLACVPAGTISPATQAQIDCAMANSREPKGLALCSTMASLPPAAREIARCATRPGAGRDARADLTCLALVGGSPEMKAAASCLEQNNKDWKAAALCAASKSGNLPPDVGKAVQCAQSSTSATGMGACMVADKLPGDAGKVAQCYVSGGGNPAATAVCMASDGLTQDQRIALQCAAQSAGVPATWAVCTGGQLAWKEFNNCRGGRAFDDKCFGKGNDLRKFVEGITGTEIGPNSVVADVVNVYIKVAEFYVNGAESIVNGGAHVVQEAGKVFEEQAKKLEKVAKDPGKAAGDCVRTLWDCVRPR